MLSVARSGGAIPSRRSPTEPDSGGESQDRSFPLEEEAGSGAAAEMVPAAEMAREAAVVPRRQSSHEQAMVPEEVVRLIRDESFQPGPRPAIFNPENNQVRTYYAVGQKVVARVKLTRAARFCVADSGCSRSRRRTARSARRRSSDGATAAAPRAAAPSPPAATTRSADATAASTRPPRRKTTPHARLRPFRRTRRAGSTRYNRLNALRGVSGAQERVVPVSRVLVGAL